MEVSVMSYMSQKKYSHLSLLLDAGDASRDVLAVASGWRRLSLHADVLWGSFVTHSSLLRNECVTNEPERTSARRLEAAVIIGY